MSAPFWLSAENVRGVLDRSRAASDRRQSLKGAFFWCEMPQGHDHWSRVSRALGDGRELDPADRAYLESLLAGDGQAAPVAPEAAPAPDPAIAAVEGWAGKPVCVGRLETVLDHKASAEDRSHALLEAFRWSSARGYEWSEACNRLERGGDLTPEERDFLERLLAHHRRAPVAPVKPQVAPAPPRRLTAEEEARFLDAMIEAVDWFAARTGYDPECGTPSGHFYFRTLDRLAARSESAREAAQ